MMLRDPRPISTVERRHGVATREALKTGEIIPRSSLAASFTPRAALRSPASVLSTADSTRRPTLLDSAPGDKLGGVDRVLAGLIGIGGLVSGIPMFLTGAFTGNIPLAALGFAAIAASLFFLQAAWTGRKPSRFDFLPGSRKTKAS